MTWYDALAEELDLHGEDIDTDLLSCTATIDQLDSPYPTFRLWFTAWTKNRVYFTVSNAAGTWIESCFRNPEPAHKIADAENAKIRKVRLAAMDGIMSWVLDMIGKGTADLARELRAYQVELSTEFRNSGRRI